MSKNVLFIMAVLLFALLTIDGKSQTVDPCRSDASVGCPGMRLRICPGRDFDNIGDVCVVAPIEVWVRDATGAGIPNIPITDFWLDACDPAQELCLCIPPGVPVYADSPTDAQGYTTISGTICGGGCVLSGGLHISVQGLVFEENYPDCNVVTCLDIVIVSPDITNDCRVTLADFSAFTDSYNKAEGMDLYNDCCDYTGDSECTLSDFAFFAEHYQH